MAMHLKLITMSGFDVRIIYRALKCIILRENYSSKYLNIGANFVGTQNKLY